MILAASWENWQFWQCATTVVSSGSVLSSGSVQLQFWQCAATVLAVCNYSYCCSVASCCSPKTMHTNRAMSPLETRSKETAVSI